MQLQTEFPYLYNNEWWFFDSVWIDENLDDGSYPNMKYCFLDKHGYSTFFPIEEVLDFVVVTSKFDLPKDLQNLEIPKRRDIYNETVKKQIQ